MQRRTGVNDPTTTNTPGRSTAVDVIRTPDESVSVRDLVLTGGVRGLSVKEMFGER